MSASTTFTRPVGHLSASLDSKVVLPGDERFDDARRALPGWARRFRCCRSSCATSAASSPAPAPATAR